MALFDNSLRYAGLFPTVSTALRTPAGRSKNIPQWGASNSNSAKPATKFTVMIAGLVASLVTVYLGSIEGGYCGI